MADDRSKQNKTGGKADPRRAEDVRQRDLASDIQGRNKLQGNDQDAVRNQRRQQPKVGGTTGRPRSADGKK
ncbi:MAG: hypothetical protein ACOC71_00955 [Hyphomicrobiales bacterium]